MRSTTDAPEMIPLTSEISFVFRLSLVICLGSLLFAVLLTLLMSGLLVDDYGSALRAISTAGERINISVLTALAVQILVSGVLVFIFTLWFSHRISGPLFRLRSTMQELADGRPTVEVVFREGDFLKTVAGIFNRRMLSLRHQRETITEVRHLLEKLESDGRSPGPDELSRLEELHKRLEGRDE